MCVEYSYGVAHFRSMTLKKRLQTELEKGRTLTYTRRLQEMTTAELLDEYISDYQSLRNRLNETIHELKEIRRAFDGLQK